MSLPSGRQGHGQGSTARSPLAELLLFRFRSRMGSKRLDKSSDYNRHGFDLQVKCRGCGHVGRIDADALPRRSHRAMTARYHIPQPDGSFCPNVDGKPHGRRRS